MIAEGSWRLRSCRLAFTLRKQQFFSTLPRSPASWRWQQIAQAMRASRRLPACSRSALISLPDCLETDEHVSILQRRPSRMQRVLE